MDTTDPNQKPAVTAVPEECDDFDIDTLHNESAAAAPLSFSAPMVICFAIAAFLAGAYLITLGSGSGAGAGGTAGAEPAKPLEPRDLGKKVYLSNCKSCHQTTGLGSPGQYPPLAGSEWVINGNKRPILILLYGISGPMTVNGVNYNGNMQAWAGSLDDEQIANTLTYIRSEWGNNAPPVTADQVAAMRAEYGNRPQFTAPELSQVPLDANVPGGAAPSASIGNPHDATSGLAAAH